MSINIDPDLAPVMSEPPPGSVITWAMRYAPGGTIYQYAAVRVEGHGWYTTSTKWPDRLSWDALRGTIGHFPAVVLESGRLLCPNGLAPAPAPGPDLEPLLRASLEQAAERDLVADREEYEAQRQVEGAR